MQDENVFNVRIGRKQMIKYVRTVIFCVMLMLLSGCSSAEDDRYSIEEICGYVVDHQGELEEAAEAAARILSKENPSMFQGEDGELLLTTGNSGEYIEAELLEEIDPDDIELLKGLFANSEIDSIRYTGKVLNGDKSAAEDLAEYYICMKIDENVRPGSLSYHICFIDTDDPSVFQNPLESYDSGGFTKIADYENNSVSWVSDHRFDPKLNTSHTRYKADIVKATDGIWVSRQAWDVPLLELFLHG